MSMTPDRAWHLIETWVAQKVARRTSRGHLSEADGALILHILEQAQLCWLGKSNAPTGRNTILSFTVEPAP